MSEGNGTTYSTEERVRGLIQQLDDYINHYHNGSVEMVSLEGNVLTVRLGGACQDCPLSPTTLHGWVAGTIRQFFPEITEIKSIE
jgi:Fe-S cluster biogenesis protein NfuA